ncbi:hypothetical protein TPB0596_11920 [Tsukamurella pulmonis]|uniref:hypothetical protein n=1 Tax=Tsukamurella pulmonis TaxID=47312 RepID=UPI001EDFA232|nr:hypothetical protein [Tsukamurella pulmonis]BDD81429.1 hypothetical protein TPB0596_11920 [Tsukamurella pulmonis]
MRWPWQKRAERDDADCVACQGPRASMQVHVFHVSAHRVEARVALNPNAPALDPRNAASAVFLTMIVHLDNVLGDGAGARTAERVLADLDELRGGRS